jgi:hypothetical protein
MFQRENEMRVCVVALALALAAPAVAQGTAAADGTDAGKIKAMMDKSAEDWNRGDIDAFATAYKNSPDILFMGAVIQRGYAAMVARYKQAYPTRDAMGTLSFSRIEVQPLDERFATVTGRFHLERTGAGGGNDDGYYLLVVEKTPDGWKIVRDDSSELPKPKPKAQ